MSNRTYSENDKFVEIITKIDSEDKFIIFIYEYEYDI